MPPAGYFNAFMMRLVIFMLAWVCYCFARSVMADLMVKYEVYDINLALHARTLVNWNEALPGEPRVEGLPFLLTLVPLCVIQLLSVGITGLRHVAWNGIALAIALLGLILLVAGDAIAGIGRPLASIGGEDANWLVRSAMALFVVTEVLRWLWPRRGALSVPEVGGLR